jgi:hypothetical protein
MHRYFPIVVLLAACSPNKSDCLDKLNQELGQKYAEPLTSLTNEFECIILESNGSNFADKCRNFLKPLASGKDKEFYFT